MNKRVKQISRVVLLTFMAFMVLNISSDLFSTVQLKHALSKANTENEQLKTETDTLNNEVTKLKDDEYIQSYVSGTMFSTEKGTTVYILPDDESESAPE
ncbi:FtsB family cell division protein [Mycoplasma sp. P36-A1]|uniref:FtsB family cell division protein n=1 Tax=Mycoplasma sp. P36-A1 TaxID=3252900 RepID=UPI003C2F3529